MHIELDDLSRPEIAELLKEHMAHMFLVTPRESVHALPIEGLRRPDITFWSVWESGELLGFGALKELDPQHGEIKSMRTASAHLRKGVAHAVVQQVDNFSKTHRVIAIDPHSQEDDVSGISIFAELMNAEQRSAEADLSGSGS